MAKYLVTGGAGFIGSNIVEALVKKGEQVRVLDNLSAGFIENLTPIMDKIDFIKGDIRNTPDVKKALNGIDYVIHQAALRSVAKSVDAPFETHDVNATGTLNMVIYAREEKVKRMVYASTSAAYGDSDVYPQTEDFQTNPLSPYGVSKLAGELYCRMASATLGLETVSLRYFNVYGPRQNPESQYSAVIPAFIEKLQNNKPCTIDGEGKQERDFVYVGDVARANIAACTAKGVSGKFFNVGTGESYSVLDVAETLKKIMGKSIDNLYGERRPGDPDRTYADITKLKNILGVEPKTSFDEGLKKTVEWFSAK
ncbi:MAG: SDR family oxidoreductase [Candidatus Omnitrophica bacterium]|nr:SDR family oxidoreductase [Candidatus Omnitrophota bacterium]